MSLYAPWFPSFDTGILLLCLCCVLGVQGTDALGSLVHTLRIVLTAMLKKMVTETVDLV